MADTVIGIALGVAGAPSNPSCASRRRGRGRRGDGLGLAIAHAIVAARRGTLTVKREPGAGSRITIRLPLSDRS